MYTDRNFKSKKELKEAVAKGVRVTCHTPGPYPCPDNGSINLEGPHYPSPHRWYATATMKDGAIVPGSVK